MITNTLTAPNSITFTPYATAISDSTIVKRFRMNIRMIVAVTLFVLAGFASIGADLNLAQAKNAARRVALKVRDVKSKGQFRLLNIYNTLKATNPEMVNAMNNAKSGLASWYGGMFHGRLTAMGTRYDMNSMTAAHRTLPLGTWVQVTNANNGKTAIVQVTDRGPYVANRIMDLSSAAAIRLGYKDAGTTKIDMKVLGMGFASAEEAARAAGIDATGGALASSQNDLSAASTVDSTGVTGQIAMAIPAAFNGVSTRTQSIPVENTSSDLDGIVSAVTTLTSGSPIHAIANIFA
jgi:rare lipoprotein A